MVLRGGPTRLPFEELLCDNRWHSFETLPAYKVRQTTWPRVVKNQGQRSSANDFVTFRQEDHTKLLSESFFTSAYLVKGWIAHRARQTKQISKPASYSQVWVVVSVWRLVSCWSCVLCSQQGSRSNFIHFNGAQIYILKLTSGKQSTWVALQTINCISLQWELRGTGFKSLRTNDLVNVLNVLKRKHWLLCLWRKHQHCWWCSKLWTEKRL